MDREKFKQEMMAKCPATLSQIDDGRTSKPGSTRKKQQSDFSSRVLANNAPKFGDAGCSRNRADVVPMTFGGEEGELDCISYRCFTERLCRGAPVAHGSQVTRTAKFKFNPARPAFDQHLKMHGGYRAESRDIEQAQLTGTLPSPITLIVQRPITPALHHSGQSLRAPHRT